MDGVADPITPLPGGVPGQAVGQGTETGGTSSILAVGWYRFRTTLGRKWASYVALVTLIGLRAGRGVHHRGPAHPGFYLTHLKIDGQTVPVIDGSPGATVRPTVL
jgi:hypothetical protein